MARFSHLLTILLLLVYATSAWAGECPIQLKMGLLIAPDHIRVLNLDRTQVQINHDRQLFVRGEEVLLTNEQQKLVHEFSTGLRKELPEIVTIAMDSIDLGFNSIDQVIQGVSGTDTAKGVKAHFGELKGALLKRFARSGDNFYIAPQAMNELEGFFEDELSNQVREVVTGSLKVMLSAMGDAYNRSSSAIEGQPIDMQERVDVISREVEKSLEYNASRLAEQSRAFCKAFEALEDTETRLQKHIPSLNKYDILANENLNQD